MFPNQNKLPISNALNILQGQSLRVAAAPHQQPQSVVVGGHQFNYATPDVQIGPKAPYPPLNRGISFNGAASGLPNPLRTGTPLTDINTNLQPLPDFTVTNSPSVLPSQSAMHGIYQGPAYFARPPHPLFIRA